MTSTPCSSGEHINNQDSYKYSLNKTLPWLNNLPGWTQLVLYTFGRVKVYGAFDSFEVSEEETFFYTIWEQVRFGVH